MKMQHARNYTPENNYSLLTYLNNKHQHQRMSKHSTNLICC